MPIDKEALERFRNHGAETITRDSIESQEENQDEEIEEKEPQEKAEDSELNLRYSFLNYALQEKNEEKKIILLAKGLVDTDEGGIASIPQLQKEILFFFLKYRKKYHLNIQVAVGSGKTTLITDVICIYEKIEDIKNTMLYLSEVDSVAQTRLNQVKSKLYRYHEIMEKPFKLEMDNAKDFRILGNDKRDPSGLARGILSRYTGLHVDRIVLDDIETIDTISVMDDIRDALNTKVNKRLSPTGKIIAINTPYMRNGIVKELEDRNGWLTLKIGLKHNLIISDNVELAIKAIESAEIEPETKEELIECLLEKIIFEAVEICKRNNLTEIETLVKSCVDFNYNLQIIKRGKVIEEREVPAWSWLIEQHGEEILNSFLYTNQSFMLTYALSAEESSLGGFFPHAEKAKRTREEILKIEGEGYKVLHTYDLSGTKRKGTIKTTHHISKESFIIKAQKASSNSFDFVENCILNDPTSFHMVEMNSFQGAYFEQMIQKLPQELRKMILFHITPNKTVEVLRSKASMNVGFATGEILIEEDGDEIADLLFELNSYTGIKKGKAQFDRVDSAWFAWHNREHIKSIVWNMQLKEYKNTPRKRKRRARGL